MTRNRQLEKQEVCYYWQRISRKIAAFSQSLSFDEIAMVEDGEFSGDLFLVPDSWWGFEAFGRTEHPGVCIGHVPPGFKVVLLKGTDLRSALYRDVHVVVENDEINGLRKPTAFCIKPRLFSARKIACLAEKQIGRVSDTDLTRMRSELVRLFGQEQDSHE